MLFPVLKYCKATVNITVFLGSSASFLPGKNLGVEWPVCTLGAFFSSIRNCQMVFQRDRTTSYSFPQSMRNVLTVVPDPLQHFMLCLPNFNHSGGCGVASHYRLSLHFPMTNCTEQLLMCLLPVLMSSCKWSVSSRFMSTVKMGLPFMDLQEFYLF